MTSFWQYYWKHILFRIIFIFVLLVLGDQLTLWLLSFENGSEYCLLIQCLWARFFRSGALENISTIELIDWTLLAINTIPPSLDSQTLQYNTTSPLYEAIEAKSCSDTSVRWLWTQLPQQVNKFYYLSEWPLTHVSRHILRVGKYWRSN